MRAAERIDSLPHLPAPLAIDRISRDLIQVVHRLQRLGTQNIVRGPRVHRRFLLREEHSLRRNPRLRAPVHQIATVRQSLRVLQIALGGRWIHVVHHAQRQHPAHEARQMAHLRLETPVRALLAAEEQSAGAASDETLREAVHRLVVHGLKRLGLRRERTKTHFVLFPALDPHFEEIFVVRIAAGAHAEDLAVVPTGGGVEEQREHAVVGRRVPQRLVHFVDHLLVFLVVRGVSEIP